MPKKYDKYLKDFFGKVVPDKKEIRKLLLITCLGKISQVAVIAIAEFMIRNISVITTTNATILFTLGITVIITFAVSVRYSSVLTANQQQEIQLSLQRKCSERVISADMRQVENISLGDYITLFQTDTLSISRFFTDTLKGIIAGSFQFALVIFYGIYLSWELTVIILFLSVVSVVLPNLLEKTIKEISHVNKKNEATNRHLILKIIENLSLISVFDIKNYILKLFQNNQEEYCANLVEEEKRKSFLESSSASIGLLTTMLWIIVGLFLMNYNLLTISVLFAFMNLSDSIIWPFVSLPLYMSDMYEEHASLERIISLFELTEAVSLEERSAGKNLLEINHITFSFDNKEPIIKDIHFVIASNEKCSIIGPSGVGKTTLMKLMMGFYIPQSGCIELTEQGITYSGESILKMISYVPQRNSMFSDSIRNNILCGDQWINTENVDSMLIELAKKAQIYEFIQTLPNGFETKIGEGCDLALSEGQKQRISIARAMAKQVPYLFMDEASAALDQETEKDILDVIKMLDNTIVMITHRENVVEILKDRIIKLG